MSKTPFQETSDVLKKQAEEITRDLPVPPQVASTKRLVEDYLTYPPATPPNPPGDTTFLDVAAIFCFCGGFISLGIAIGSHIK